MKKEANYGKINPVIKMIVVIGIIIALFIYFLYILNKYAGSEKAEYQLEYFRDKEYIKYSPMIVGFLGKRKIKEQDFVATVLDYVIKGDILMKKTEDGDYIFTIEKQIKGNPIEIKALKIFFNEDLEIGVKQSLSLFKEIMKNEKIFGNLGVIQREFNKDIREYFDKKQEVKQLTKKENMKNNIICYILFLISIFILAFSNEYKPIAELPVIFMGGTVIFLIFMLAPIVIRQYILGRCSWIIPVITSLLSLQTLTFTTSFVKVNYVLPLIILLAIIMGAVIVFDDIVQRKKTKLANATEMIKGLKRYIQDYSNIDEYDLYNVNLWDEYYIYAIALGIKKI